MTLIPYHPPQKKPPSNKSEYQNNFPPGVGRDGIVQKATPSTESADAAISGTERHVDQGGRGVAVPHGQHGVERGVPNPAAGHGLTRRRGHGGGGGVGDQGLQKGRPGHAGVDGERVWQLLQLSGSGRVETVL